MADQHATINRLRYVPAGAAVVSIMFGVAVLESFVLVVGLPAPAPIPLDALLFMLAGVALLAFRLDFDPLRIGAAGAGGADLGRSAVASTSSASASASTHCCFRTP